MFPVSRQMGLQPIRGLFPLCIYLIISPWSSCYFGTSKFLLGFDLSNVLSSRVTKDTIGRIIWFGKIGTVGF